MITQGQFNKAMSEINEAFAKASKRIEALEKKVADLSKPNTAKKSDK